MAGTALTRGPRRIAVLRFSALGDVLLTTPALEALKEAWPDSERLLVTQAGPARLLQESALIQERLVMRPGESVGQLRGRLLAWRPDAILDLHSSLRSRLLTASLPWIRSVRWKKRDLLDTLRVRLLGLPWRSERLIAERSHEAVERLVVRVEIGAREHEL